MNPLDGVTRTAHWLRGCAVETAVGRVWPSAGCDEGGPDDRTLARGSSGVVLFFLRAFEALHDEQYLSDARAGLEVLLHAIDPAAPRGWYDGLAGTGYVLAEAHRVTGDERYRAGAATVAQLLRATAFADELDLYSGAAGVGLTMLHLGRVLDDPRLTAFAFALAELVQRDGRRRLDGTMWPHRRSAAPAAPEWPNFAHGTAGIAYFLATTAQVSGRLDLLEAALSGAIYLGSLARNESGVFEVPVRTGAQAVYWCNWCHGPVGTGRLWFRLYEVTADAVWLDRLHGAGRAVLARLEPDGEIPSLGNEASLCCGSAGVADFLLDLHRVTGLAEYADGMHRAVAHVAKWAIDDSAGMRWTAAQATRTGWLDGAAGTAYTLLRVGLSERGSQPAGVLPDSPFGVPAMVTR